jgi:aminopeptidase-like protein
MSPTNLEFDDALAVGKFCHDLAARLFPICRSITGEGTRQTLQVLAEHVPELQMCAVPSGTQCFDWTVPDEWNISEGFIESSDGERIVDFANSNLHVVGYSTPVDERMELDQLEPHLHSFPDQPNAIPYITSYYARRWGFCLTHKQRTALPSGRYHVVIRSELKRGVLNYGEVVLPGATDDEIFLSTYICHPSMANNELSGPVVATALALYLRSKAKRRYTYRIIFVPETIGSVTYISRNLDQLKSRVIAGFNITCVGDERTYSYLPSRRGDTLADQAAKHVLRHICQDYRAYTWLDRGSDERQYCAPGVDLPVCSIMRSKYGEYPEYHTSLDDLEFVTPAGLGGAFAAIRGAIDAIEENRRPRAAVLCEPQLGKRGLYPTLSTKETKEQVRTMMDLISYADGTRTLLDIADLTDQPMARIVSLSEMLEREGLITVNDG